MLININDLSPSEIVQRLPGIEGITPEIAQRLADVYRGKGSFKDQDEFLATLEELGVEPRFFKNVRTFISTTKLRQDEKRIDDALGLVPPDEIDETEENGLFDGYPPGEPTFEIVGEPPPAQQNRPLVFIPGLFASTLNLEENLTFRAGQQRITQPFKRKIWPPIGVDGVDGTLKELVRLLRSGRRNRIRAGTETVLNAYSGLIDNLADIGFSTDRNNLFIFTYNWTRSNQANADDLATKIETDYLPNFRRRYPDIEVDQVDVICHSMGGIVARAAIKKFLAKIRRTVYIGTPHFGSPMAYFLVNQHVPITTLSSEILFDLVKKDEDFDDLDEALHLLANSARSFFELLPDKFYLDNIPMIEERGFFQVPRRIFGVDNTYSRNAWRIQSSIIRSAIRNAMIFKEVVLGSKIPGENIRIYSDAFRTNDMVAFNGSFSDPFSSRWGDKTVPTYSATAGTPKFNRRDQIRPVAASHNQLPNHPRTFYEITRFLDLPSRVI